MGIWGTAKWGCDFETNNQLAKNPVGKSKNGKIGTKGPNGPTAVDEFWAKEIGFQWGQTCALAKVSLFRGSYLDLSDRLEWKNRLAQAFWHKSRKLKQLKSRLPSQKCNLISSTCQTYQSQEYAEQPIFLRTFIFQLASSNPQKVEKKSNSPTLKG